MKMSYWKTTVVPGFKKMFDKSGKKAAAAEACKAFADSKEGITKELEEKKPELEAPVAKIYEASPPEIKTLLKEPKASGIKKQSAHVQKFLEELAGIDFPGSKLVSEASAKLGTSSLSGPIIFVFEQVSTFVVTEKKDEVAVKTTEVVAATEDEASVSTTDKEIVIEGEKKAEEEITPAAPIEEVTKTEKKVEAPEEVIITTEKKVEAPEEAIITTEKKVEPVPELPVAKPVPVAEPVAVAAEPAAAAEVETPTVAPAAAAAAPVEPATKA